MSNVEVGDIWKHFFDRPRRNYNPYMVKLNDYPKYIMYDKNIMDLYRGRWNEYFGNKNPIYLEIGSGSGNFANCMCEKHPERNHMALEIRFKRLVLSAKKSESLGLENILFIKRRGEEIVNFIGEEEIEGMYINFPDPWDGKEKNRILQPSLFKLLDVILKKGGTLFFKTDHDGYYSDVLEFMEKMDGYKVSYHTSDLHNSPLVEENIQTEFESLFIYKHNKNINYIEIKKTK
ncbi:tRNA (guanosine(46)-N7)-methyltransferase TrmB [uncultured Ilyobacter sp.]|uniref:tRNA (guanosine(46)-N7)-methyltransferase TrmB n=1 Tax=uncultured Ilyobacter sp. TaxID=544433 RepID=UPI0029C631B9|nr:tRNA (guanosine(46)-N7)-methyltransferase TrmB [uncultured Ilyobacter sp.]